MAATSGGGALNLVAGLGESLASRVPVLALVGQTPTTMDGRGSFQDTSGRNGSLNAEAVFSAVSVSCERVLAPADIFSALPRAIAAARTGGPAVLLLPKDIQQGCAGPANVHGHRAQDLRPDRQPAADRRRCCATRTVRSPSSWASRWPATMPGPSSKQLRAVLRARVATVPDAKDVAGTPGLGSSSALGVTGVMGHPGVAEAVAASAVCLVVGTRLSVTARAGLDDALAAGADGLDRLGAAVCSVHPRAHRRPARLAAHADRGTVRTADGRPGVRVPDAVRRTELRPPPFVGAGVRYRDAMAVLDGVLPDGADIVVDAGNTGASAIHYLPARRDGRFVVALGMGGMGYSFGAGIGMAFGRANSGRPGGRTVVIAGDGAFFMHGMEMHTAVQYRLPVTFVLFNNNAHAMCVTREQLFYDDLYSYNRFRPSRLGAGLAAMFPGLTVRRRHRPRRACRGDAARRSTSTAPRWSASNAPPTKSRRSHHFSTNAAAKSTATEEIPTGRRTRTDVAASA